MGMSSRTAAGPPDADGGKPEAAHSAPLRLAREVDRLKRELVEARAEVRRLEALANEDPLCAVLNRRGFDRALRQAAAHVSRYGTPAALLAFDLDGFKQVNDTRGHGAGDEVLKAVAAALARSVRASDLVARTGGDEFAVLLWHVDETRARRKAEQLVSLLPIGASFGAVSLAGLGADEAAAAADRLMYEHKHRRRHARSSGEFSA
jgi:diguanylate cyclase (GGDEF)-like protein